MPYIVCAEETDRRWVAHVPDLPGCFASHRDREAAIAAIPAAIEAYRQWCAGHGLHVSGISGPMVVDEVIRAWDYEDDYEVNAFFASDRPPLTAEELPEIERLLQATRADLLSSVEGLDADDLLAEFPDERWPIAGILGHVANAEWWYLDRLGLAFPKSQIPEDPFERLDVVRSHMLASLPTLTKRTGIVTMAGETWSSRKVVRRALWHERDHTEHILKLRAKLVS
ncbi:MAG: DinB family protein [Chloroflexota bacterium]